MPSPSRGRWNAGALTPSTRTCVFSTDELLLRRCDVAAEEDLNRFDVALCDGLPVRFFDANAAFRPGFTVRVLEAFADFAALGCRDAGLGDFLRDFLDIRLPFV